MQSPRIRPQYELFVDVSAAETLRLVEARIEASAAIRGWVAEPYAELRLPELAYWREGDRYVRGGHYKQKTLLEFLGEKS